MIGLGISQWLKSAVEWVKALLNRKVTTAEDFRKAVEVAVQNTDEDADGNISLRELITFILRVV